MAALMHVSTSLVLLLSRGQQYKCFTKESLMKGNSGALELGTLNTIRSLWVEHGYRLDLFFSEAAKGPFIVESYPTIGDFKARNGWYVRRAGLRIAAKEVLLEA